MNQADLETLEAEAREAIRAAADAQALGAIEKRYLAKGGVVGNILASIPKLPPEERKGAGQGANRLKQAISTGLEERRGELADAELASELAAPDFDPTLPGKKPQRGSLHPMTLVRREVEDVFTSMGYSVLDGPEVELDYYNFQALNIPADHPSREMQDTFYCAGADGGPGDLVMRTQTSPVQIRAMEASDPPLRVIVPGRVFRNEEQDATHEHTFHQVEGLVIDRGITVGHLTGTLKSFLREFFREEVGVRLRPGYFPFVEPGFEFDIECVFCDSGCRVCKGTRWVEFCGSGMVHPRVLQAGNVDPEVYTGFAFGFGLDRLVMLRYGIDDIRNFMGGDVRFLEQFQC